MKSRLALPRSLSVMKIPNKSQTRSFNVLVKSACLRRKAARGTRVSADSFSVRAPKLIERTAEETDINNVYSYDV